MDDNDTAINAGEETPVSEAPAEEQQPSTDEASDEVQHEELKSQPQQDEKPTRAERRIRDLSSKLREATKPKEEARIQSVADTLGIVPPPWQSQPEPQVQPGQEITADDFEKIVSSRASKAAELIVTKILGERDQQETQKRTVQAFADDSEHLMTSVPILNNSKENDQYDETIDDAFTKLVERINTDANGNFIPVMKPSEIWEQFSKALTKERTNGEASVTKKMVEQAAQAAVPPTGTAKKLSSEDELIQAMKEGKITAEEAEKYLTKVWD